MQITLEWQGREYVIPEDKAFQIGEQVEDIIPITDLPDLAMRPNFHKIARVYGTMLRFAGAKVTDQEIWKHFMAEMRAGKANGSAGQAITMLTVMLMDGAFDAGGEEGKKETAS
jgi:hypothetical protein